MSGPGPSRTALTQPCWSREPARHHAPRRRPSDVPTTRPSCCSTLGTNLSVYPGRDKREESEHARARRQTELLPQMYQHRPLPGPHGFTDALTSCPPPHDAEAQNTRAAPPPLDPQHATLKYSLLGPSLTKAGQDSVDQSKVRTHVLTRCAAPKPRL